MLFYCHTLLPIEAHCVLSCNLGQRPPHDRIIDVKVDQHVPDFVRHVLHRVEGIRVWSTFVVDNNTESNSVNDQSPLTLCELLWPRSYEDAEDGRGKMMPPD